MCVCVCMHVLVYVLLFMYVLRIIGVFLINKTMRLLAGLFKWSCIVFLYWCHWFAYMFDGWMDGIGWDGTEWDRMRWDGPGGRAGGSVGMCVCVWEGEKSVLRITLLACWLSCLLLCLHVCLLDFLRVVFVWLHSCLFPCLPQAACRKQLACLPACLFAGLFACSPACLPVRLACRLCNGWLVADVAYRDLWEGRETLKVVGVSSPPDLSDSEFGSCWVLVTKRESCVWIDKGDGQLCWQVVCYSHWLRLRVGDNMGDRHPEPSPPCKLTEPKRGVKFPKGDSSNDEGFWRDRGSSRSPNPQTWEAAHRSPGRSVSSVSRRKSLQRPVRSRQNREMRLTGFRWTELQFFGEERQPFGFLGKPFSLKAIGNQNESMPNLKQLSGPAFSAPPLGWLEGCRMDVTLWLEYVCFWLTQVYHFKRWSHGLSIQASHGASGGPCTRKPLKNSRRCAGCFWRVADRPTNRIFQAASSQSSRQTRGGGPRNTAGAAPAVPKVAFAVIRATARYIRANVFLEVEYM